MDTSVKEDATAEEIVPVRTKDTGADGSVSAKEIVPETEFVRKVFAEQHYLDPSTVELITSLEAGPVCDAASMYDRPTNHHKEIIIGSFEQIRCTTGDTGEKGETSLGASSPTFGMTCPDSKNHTEGATQQLEIQSILDSVEADVHCAQIKYLECLRDAIDGIDLEQFLAEKLLAEQSALKSDTEKQSLGVTSMKTASLNSETLKEPYTQQADSERVGHRYYTTWQQAKTGLLRKRAPEKVKQQQLLKQQNTTQKTTNGCTIPVKTLQENQVI
jgi:hypothetical protein